MLCLSERWLPTRTLRCAPPPIAELCVEHARCARTSPETVLFARFFR